MDPEASVRGILSGIAHGDLDRADDCLDALRGWIRGGGFKPYQWTADECAAFVTACANTLNTLKIGGAS
jgi:hypothetical protein